MINRYYFRLEPKLATRTRFQREIEPANVKGHAAYLGVDDTRFVVERDGQGLIVLCAHQHLTRLLHDKLGRLYEVEPMQQEGFERRRVRVH